MAHDRDTPPDDPGQAGNPAPLGKTRQFTRSSVTRIRAAIDAAKQSQIAEAAPESPRDVQTGATTSDTTSTTNYDPMTVPLAPPRPPRRREESVGVMVESERVQAVESTHRYSHSTAERLRAQTAAARAGAHAGGGGALPVTRPPLRTPPSMVVEGRAGRHPSPFPGHPAGEIPSSADAPVGPWHSVVRRCAILSRESDAVLTTDEDGSLTLLAAENALAVVVGLVAGAGPVVDVVLDWGDRTHPTEVLRFQPSAAELARIFPTLSADSAIAMFARGLAGAGALTSPAAHEFPGPPWAQYADTAALERAWRAAAERGTP